MTTAERSEPAEDWADDVFVEHWIARQAGRAAVRNRQFAMLRAVVPHSAQAAFRYLNVGAGHGPLDELLLARFPRAEGTLVDGSRAMLRHAQSALASFGERSRYVQADLASPGWTAELAGPYDVVLSCIALHNLFDPARIRAVYKDIFQLLADGGLFVNFDYVRMPHPGLQPLAAWTGSDPDSGYMTRGGGDNMPGTTDEQLGWLREAGFALVDCYFKEFRLALFGGFKGTPRVPDPAARGS